MKWIIRTFKKRTSFNAGAQESIRRYLKGELSPEEKENFEVRLRDTPDLRKEMHAWEDLYALLEKGGTPERSGEFWEDYKKSIARRLDSIEERRSHTTSRHLLNLKPSYVAAVAMAAIVAVIAYKVWISGEEGNRLADVGQESWLELCINEFDTVSREEVLFEPPPQPVSRDK